MITVHNGETELSIQLPSSHPLTAPVHPPERVTGPPELHHSEGRYQPLAKTRLERCLQQPERFSLPLWHQHHPSDSLDLLELPQGPALLSAGLDWGLPRADQAAFGAAWANLVACLFGWREPLLTTTLWSWWQDAPQPRLAHLQLLAALLAEAPERFPLEQH